MPSSIFISYSHQDAGLVKPVVGLLRGTKDLVFQDLDNIKPGGKWRGQIEDAVRAAHLIVLFWCYHSSRSTEVRAEYKLALVTGKDVLPVLLDTTPLPEELNEFQWVDFQQLVGSVHRSYRRWIALGAVSLLIVLIMSFVLIFMNWFAPPRTSSPPPEIYPLPTPSPPPEIYPPPSPPAPYSPMLWLVIFVAIILAFVVWRVQRAWRRRAGTPQPTNDRLKLMVDTLREELSRRGIGSE